MYSFPAKGFFLCAAARTGTTEININSSKGLFILKDQCDKCPGVDRDLEEWQTTVISELKASRYFSIVICKHCNGKHSRKVNS